MHFGPLYYWLSFHIYFQVVLQLTVTERAGHAFGVMASISNRELSSYDGVVVVVSNEIFFLVFNFSYLMFLGPGFCLVIKYFLFSFSVSNCIFFLLIVFIN